MAAYSESSIFAETLAVIAGEYTKLGAVVEACRHLIYEIGMGTKVMLFRKGMAYQYYAQF